MVGVGVEIEVVARNWRDISCMDCVLSVAQGTNRRLATVNTTAVDRHNKLQLISSHNNNNNYNRSIANIANMQSCRQLLLGGLKWDTLIAHLRSDLDINNYTSGRGRREEVVGIEGVSSSTRRP